MINARIVHIDNLETAKEEVRKTGADAGSIPWLSPKAVQLAIKLEGVKPVLANLIKQEMLAAGGDAAVNRGSLNFSVEATDILILGTYKQYTRLVFKLSHQSFGLNDVASEIEKLLVTVEKKDGLAFECREYSLPLGEKTYIMGILNVPLLPQPQMTVESIIKRAKKMVQDGADIIGVGLDGEQDIAPENLSSEVNTIAPIVEALVKELKVPISVDTFNPEAAKKSLEAGAHIINDIQALQEAPEMTSAIASYGAGVILIHNQAHTHYNDIMSDIIRYLRKSISIAQNAGIEQSNMIVDPGIGFGKDLEQNLEVMRRLKEMRCLNLPVLLGTSRKPMIGNILDLPADERLEGTAATITLGIAYGIDIVRVHDIKEMARVARMTDAMIRQ